MITILTPTYNRAYILENAYRSLLKQSMHSFEWIIVDDGSSDNTEELCDKWKKECFCFEIRYIKQNNGGKHTALNRGVQLAKSDFILILDSDDYLEDNAVELIHTWVSTIEDDDKFAGVAGLRATMAENKVIGGHPDKEYIDATNLERRKFGLLGDKAEIYKTSILKKYPFPVFANEKFLQESASWDRIAADGYKIRWFNSIIYRCDYLADGLTKALNENIFLNNFEGFTYCINVQVSNMPFAYKYYKIGFYKRIADKKGLSINDIKTRLNINSFQVIVGFIIYNSVCIIKEFSRKLKK